MSDKAKQAVNCGCGGAIVQCPLCHGVGRYPERRVSKDVRRYDDRHAPTPRALLQELMTEVYAPRLSPDTYEAGMDWIDEYYPEAP